MPKINSLEVVHQDTNKDSYENLHDILVALKGSQNQEVVDGEARALYEALLEMYVNDKEAFAKRIETLKAEFGNSLAQVVEEILAYASASEAYAKKINIVSAQVENANAMVQSEIYTRATQNEALASQITSLSATVGSKNKTYYQTTAPVHNPPTISLVSGDLWIDSDDDKLYRYNGTSWVEIQDNQIGVNTAAISSEATARANGDSANSTAINAVTARLDTGDFATVKTTSEASALKLQTRANLVSELSNWTLNGGLTLTQGGTWGMVATGSGSGTYTAESPFFDVAAGATYTITGDSLNFNSSGNVYFDIIFYNSSNSIVKDGAQNPIVGSHDFSITDSNRNAHAVSDTAPATAVKAKARFVVTSGTGSAVGFRQVKVERGGLPATPFSQEATVNYASAKWGVTVDANGNAAGIALMADTTGTSEFIVAANKFRVKKPDGTDGISWNGTNSRLDISGDVYANNFYGNVVGTSNINNNAVTIPLTQTSTNTVTGNGVYQLINTLTFTTSYSQNVLVIFNGQAGYSGSATQELTINVDGTGVATRGGQSAEDYPTIAWSGSLAAGTHNIYLYWYGSGSNLTINNRTLSAWVSLR